LLTNGQKIIKLKKDVTKRLSDLLKDDKKRYAEIKACDKKKKKGK